MAITMVNHENHNPSDDEKKITRLLHEADDGQPGAMDALMDAVYADLERVAARHMARQFGAGLPGATMEPAALVNESFMRLIKQRKAYANRGQFFAIATKVMLRVLTDYQRKRKAAKRGGNVERVTISLDGPMARPPKETWSPDGKGLVNATGPDDRVIDVDTLVAALGRLEDLDGRKADVVRLRVIWGLEMREIGEALEVSLATVERDWAFSKAWLAREAAEEAESGDSADPAVPEPA